MTIHCLLGWQGLSKNIKSEILTDCTRCPICSCTWVGLTDLDVPLFYPFALPVLLHSHQPQQNQADGGTLRIQVNPTQVHEQMRDPVCLTSSV